VVETLELSVVMSGRAEPWAWDVSGRGQDLYDLRGVLDRYFSRIGLKEIEYRSSDSAQWGIGALALEIRAGGEEIGRLGPVDAGTLSAFDIDGVPVIALFDLTRIARRAFTDGRYVAPSKFPAVVRDISIVLDAAVANAAVEGTIRAAGGALLSGVSLFDLYAGKGVPEGKKSLAYSLTFTPSERTMEDAEVEVLMGGIIKRLAEEHGAELRG
jgi:phenylalanyl-tRNA synthetase beta chain